MYKYLFFIFLFFYTACQKDEYFKQTYDNTIVNSKFECLKLKLSPYSNEVFDSINKLYEFNKNCDNTLVIKHKVNIYCNSEFNKNKQFHSFIQLDILVEEKLIYTIYKDLKDENIENEVIKGYKELCKTIHL